MDEMQGVEDEGEGSVLAYVTEHEFRKQRSRSPFCNFHWGEGYWRVEARSLMWRTMLRSPLERVGERCSLRPILSMK